MTSVYDYKKYLHVRNRYIPTYLLIFIKLNNTVGTLSIENKIKFIKYLFKSITCIK